MFPLWLKLLYSAFLAVLIPVYWQAYGPLNFLYFCDIALGLTLIALWTEHPLPTGMAAVGILAPQLLWLADFCWRALTGGHIVDLTEYMFDPSIPLFARGLSLFHGWLPLLLIGMVVRTGYDRRAFRWQVVVVLVTLCLCWLLVTDPSNPAGNVNKIFGFVVDGATQSVMPSWAWLRVLMALYPTVILLPTHGVLRLLVRSAGMPRE
jgi:hypothetical protein